MTPATTWITPPHWNGRDRPGRHDARARHRGAFRLTSSSVAPSRPEADWPSSGRARPQQDLMTGRDHSVMDDVAETVSLDRACGLIRQEPS